MVPDPASRLIIDEADRLKVAGLEQARSIFDLGGIGMVPIGMPGIDKHLARYPRFYSDIGFVHEFRARFGNCRNATGRHPASNFGCLIVLGISPVSAEELPAVVVYLPAVTEPRPSGSGHRTNRIDSLQDGF